MIHTVRAAGTDDLDTVVALRIEFLRAVRGPDLRPSAALVEQTRAFVLAEHGAGRLHSWLAEADDDPVGMVSVLLWPRPPRPEDLRTTEGYIINMYVVPTHQRRGIGSDLLERCLASAGDLGIGRFVLHATDQGRGLYESTGFGPESTWMVRPVAD